MAISKTNNIGIAGARKTKVLNITKGSDLVSGLKQTNVRAVADNNGILSGEVIIAKDGSGSSGTYNEQAWDKFSDATDLTSPAVIAFAYTDGDAYDVQAAGGLLGIPLTDTFNLQTALFDASKVYAVGAPLTVVKGNMQQELDGSVSFVENVSGAYGILTPVPASAGTYTIVGYVTGGKIKLTDNVNTSVSTTAKSMDIDGNVATGDVVVGGPFIWSEDSSTKFVLDFAVGFGSKTVA